MALAELGSKFHWLWRRELSENGETECHIGGGAPAARLSSAAPRLLYLIFQRKAAFLFGDTENLLSVMKIPISFCRPFSTFSNSQRPISKSTSLNSIKELHAQLVRAQMHIDPSSISEVIKHYALSPQSLPKAHLAINVRADSLTMMKAISASCFLSEWEMGDYLVKYIDEHGVVVDLYLGNTLIDMYGRRGMIDFAGRVFYQMKEKNIVSWNAMIMGYAKVGNLVAAKKLFNQMPSRDVISWTSMIIGYSLAKQHAEAVKLFQEMIASMVKPDEITVATVLSACAHLGSLDAGEAVHDYIRNHDIKSDVFVGNSLIDMYCKCGVVEKALQVFNDMKTKDSVSWTSIISGLAVNGFSVSALNVFDQMLKEGICPTHGTFVGVLVACAHVGLVDKGVEHFKSMENTYRLAPEMKHYGCVVDLMCRSGYLDMAYNFIKKMPMVPDVVIWRILLSACKLHGNLVLAEIVSKKLLELDPSNNGNYVLSSSTYAGSDRWDDVIKIRELMEVTNIQKPYAYSSIEVRI
uniref:Pentatricopeptide repeat-containing protein n=1 Tax=Cucumis melo TaxID=3656 RepID=A0A9I9ECA2_CUCME